MSAAMLQHPDLRGKPAINPKRRRFALLRGGGQLGAVAA
jgi:hypothetical protein